MGSCGSKKKAATPDLSEEEIHAIREVWIRAKNEDVGKKILQTLIEKRPKFAEYFGIQTNAESLDIKALNQSKEFHLQAHRIENFLDTAVGSLGFCPISSVYDMAHRIGQIHFYRGVNFGADNWLVFKKVTVDMVTSGKTSTCNSAQDVNAEANLLDLSNPYASENCLARLGWNKLMTVIVREMKRGFLEEAMRNCRFGVAMSGSPGLQTAVKSLVSLVMEIAARPSLQHLTAAATVRGIASRPPNNHIGLLKIGVVTTSSLYLGGLMAQKGASYLEENEIFVPADEDDDDDD